MAELSKSELISYIREVFRLEHKKNTILTECNKIQDEINKLNDKPYPEKPYLYHSDAPKQPSNDMPKEKQYLPGCLSVILGYVGFCTVIGIGASIMTVLLPNATTDLVFIPALIILGVAVVLSFLLGKAVRNYFKRKYDNEKAAEYNKKMEEYNQDVQMAEKIYHSDIAEWEKKCRLVDEENISRQSARVYKNSIKNQLLNIVPEIDKSLNKLYSYDILHRNYRNYKAVGYILLYFETGRVDTLKEAINKYEDELFKGMVVEALDEIAFNQELTYDAIRENNMLIQGATSNIGTIISQNEKISDYQQLAAANSKDILDSVQNIDFRQTIEMLDRYASN
ncbi:MAG: hypothetical protein J6D42_01325 [Clostridia bacterium]|nr:hypothetical protein [Clostridia bacterium]